MAMMIELKNPEMGFFCAISTSVKMDHADRSRRKHDRIRNRSNDSPDGEGDKHKECNRFNATISANELGQ